MFNTRRNSKVPNRTTRLGICSPSKSIGQHICWSTDIPKGHLFKVHGEWTTSLNYTTCVRNIQGRSIQDATNITTVHLNQNVLPTIFLSHDRASLTTKASVVCESSGHRKGPFFAAKKCPSLEIITIPKNFHL